MAAPLMQHTLGVQLLPHGTSEALFNAQSKPVHVPGNKPADAAKPAPSPTDEAGPAPGGAADPTGTPIPLFQCRVLHQACRGRKAANSPEPTGVRASGQKGKENKLEEAETSFFLDVVMSTGGLIWALDFTPALPAVAASSSSTAAAAAAAAVSPAEAVELACELLAAAVHPGDLTRNKLGQAVEGPGAVQIWAVPNSSRSTLPGSDRPLSHAAAREGASSSSGCQEGPSAVMCLMHKGRLTWDVKWCPDASRIWTRPMQLSSSADATPSDREGGPTGARGARGTGRPGGSAGSSGQSAAGGSGKALGSAGVLCFVSGDGCVHIVTPPLPSELTTPANPPGPGGGSSSGTACIPSVPAVQLPDQYLITQEMLMGSLPCTVEWQALPPPSSSVVSSGSGLHSQQQQQREAGMKLLVGCYDGVVSGWRVPGTRLGQLQGIFQIRVDPQPVPIWTVRWCPASHRWESVDSVQSHTFMTMSHSGTMCMWDDRDLSEPIQKHLLCRSPARAGAWVADPPSVLSGHEDGVLRQLLMDPLFFNCAKDQNLSNAFSGLDSGAIFHMHYSPGLNSLLYCGEDGMALVMPVELNADARKKLPHAPIGGLAGKKGEVHLLTGADLVGTLFAYRGGANFSIEKDIKGGSKGKGAAKKFKTSDLKDELQALHCITASPNAQGGRAWVAYGGRAGLLRAQRLVLSVFGDS